MDKLVAGVHVYIAQPPLFRLRNKSNTYYVQIEEETRATLLDLTLSDSALEAGGGRLIEGNQLARFVLLLAMLEEALIALERRGISLKLHSTRQDPTTGRLPVYHVYINSHEQWFTTREELDKFVAAQENIAGGKLSIDTGLPAAP